MLNSILLRSHIAYMRRAENTGRCSATSVKESWMMNSLAAWKNKASPKTEFKTPIGLQLEARKRDLSQGSA